MDLECLKSTCLLNNILYGLQLLVKCLKFELMSSHSGFLIISLCIDLLEKSLICNWYADLIGWCRCTKCYDRLTRCS